MNSNAVVILMIVSCLLASSTISANNSNNDDDIVSCGGFVKIAKTLPKNLLNYEHIKINLVQDTLVRESTECAPNGYYFLPVYKSGDYQLEIEGPEGWSFNTKQIALPIEFNNKDSCKDDFNFELIGFRVDGRVSSAGCSRSASLDGIKVQLRVRGTNKIVGESVTANGGLYRFESVVPSSELEVVAVHPHWQFRANAIPIKSFNWGNYRVEQDIVIEGFELTGKINYESNPLKDVDFHLESVNGAVKSISDCKSKSEKSGVVCTVQSGADGVFKMKNVPCGEYRLLASYSAGSGVQKTTYDISPRSLDVKLDGGDLQVQPDFQVKGFSVFGRVLNQNEGMSGVTILVNGKQKATTDANGNYVLDQVTAGSFKIEAQKDHVSFTALQNHRMSPSTPSLPDIKVVSYDLCGQVSVPTAPAGIKVNPREITLQGEHNKQEKKQTDNNGRFCFQVAPGFYRISISLSSQEKSKGLQFVSQTITTTITNQPMLDIIFSQTRGSVIGKIRPLTPVTGEVPAGMKLSLEPTSRVGDSVNAALSLTKTGDISFIFRDLLPGAYKINLVHSVWCWESLEKSVNIEDTEVKDNIEFVQTGYHYEVNSPHHQVALEHSINGKTDKIQLKKGSNLLCLKESGQHKFDVKSCFQFEKNADTFDTAANQRAQFNLKIEKIQLTGSVEFAVADNLPSKLSIQVRSKSGEVVKTVTASPSASNVFSYSYMATLGDELQFVPLTPEGTDFLFYPSARSASVNTENCPPSLEAIAARPGLFIRGQVFPNIDGVEITTYVERTSEQIGKSVVSDSQGHYQIGPLRDDIEYTLKASKPGYHFKKEDKGYNFNAIELGSVVVNFRDKETNQPIQGVLLSLSGEGYRNNLQSPANGSIGIYSLFPGKYFVKCLLKEYAITPSSQTIEVLEGKQIKVDVLAKRVAFSVYGSVKSLIGEAQSGIAVRAFTSNNKVADETTTDEQGSYRLRGLQPSEQYRVAIIGQPSIDRAAPAEYKINIEKSDKLNIDFTVLASGAAASSFDLSASVTLQGAQASHAILQRLRANLYNQKDNSLYRSIEFGFNSFVDFGSLPKSNNYVLKIENEVNSFNTKNNKNTAHSLLNIKVEPSEVKITQDESDTSNNRHVKFQVDISKSAIIHEQESVPYAGLIFFALVVVSVLYPSKVWNFILSVRSGELFQSKNNTRSKASKSNEDNDFLPKDLLKQKQKKSSKPKNN